VFLIFYNFLFTLHKFKGFSSKFLIPSFFFICNLPDSSAGRTPPGTPTLKRATSISSEEAEEGVTTSSPSGLTTFGGLNLGKKNKKKKVKVAADLFTDPSGAPLPKEILNSVTLFSRKQKKGIIDVWWLYDDGGLTLLLPYILTTRPNWSGCKLRVFCLANRKEELDTEQRKYKYRNFFYFLKNHLYF